MCSVEEYEVNSGADWMVLILILQEYSIRVVVDILIARFPAPLSRRE